MWRSVFLHEFPDGDVRNFHGLPGHARPGSFQFNPLAVIPGERFSYEFNDPIDDVIGFSGRLRILKPVTNQSESWLLMRVGDDVEFRVQELPGVLPGPSARARGLLRIGGGSLVSIGNVLFPHREFVDLRFDWHTSGQARLLRNSQLVGYHNSVSPGVQITVSDITVGRSDVPVGTVGGRFSIEKIFARALRRSDSLGVLSDLLPRKEVADDDPQLARCRHLLMNDLLAVGEMLRPFMVKFHEKESAPWSLDSSSQPSPFTARAVIAHQQAMKAGSALISMMRTQDFSAPALFLVPFEKFLRSLRDSLPDEFKSVAQTAIAEQPDRRQCHELLKHDLEEYGADYRPIADLIESASRIVLDLAGE